MITTRPATQGDFDFLWNLHQDTMRTYVDATYGWDDQVQLEYFKKGFRPQSLTLLEWCGELAGYYCVEQHDGSVYLASIEIARAFQNKGIGSKCLMQVMAMARERGVPLDLHVMKVNSAARRLYERIGFQVVGEISKTGKHATHDHMRWNPK